VQPLSPVVSVNRDFHCSVQQALVRIQNTGNQPIEVGDYEGSLRVSFGSEARISQSNLVETEPNELPVSISDDPAEITLEPLLLNRGDSFVLSALLVGEIDEVKVGGRISGVSKIRRKIVPENPPSWKRMRMALGGLMVFSTGYVVLAGFSLRSGSPSRYSWPLAFYDCLFDPPSYLHTALLS
jgi:hypothetical protein